ncbi:hypothetical protein DFR50_11237 [Roseiarcus fermentans]|uniref:Uncharacterized protein n=1 Tax=Roseiarcus fermentans TaxID=1473586 RepID=A0A366FEJ1_9HYPH|nr:hypothetical protein [Roseiarcus fermentans]RBP13068.1 hypothetical protein DFR50_11237 [Roseiarcus fermentans]
MKYSIWYMRPEWFGEGISGARPDPKNLEATHVHLKDIHEFAQTSPLEAIYRAMQGEVWSPRGEARGLIRSKGLEHTSMSVGDIIVPEDSGQVFIVASFGFEEVTAPRTVAEAFAARKSEPAR